MKRMSLGYINTLLAALPDGAEFSILWNGGRRHEYLARGMPGMDRRLTNTTTGREDWLPVLDVHGEIVSVDVEAFTVELIP